MARLIPRIRLLMMLGALIVLGAGVWVYYTIYTTSSFSLRHAEAFLFRRMTVAQLGEQNTYRYFFISNRRKENETGPIETRFGNQREARLSFGSFDAKIEPSLGIGMLINPTEWLQNEEIDLREVRPLKQPVFVEELRRLVSESPHRALLVLVHGFREGFPSGLRKTAFFGHVLDINSPILLFDWPGDQGSSLRGYRRAREVAGASGADLARALELVIREIEPERLWLVANSMGAQVVVDAFTHLYAEADLADADTEIEDIVLTAPDVDHEQFDRQFKREIAALAKDLTVYVSSNDRALVLSRLVNRAKRRGESTLTRDQLDEAVKISELIDEDEKLVTLVDVTPINRTRNFHNFSLETPEFFDDLYLRLSNDDDPQSRRLYRVRAQNGALYWVLTRGRS